MRIPGAKPHFPAETGGMDKPPSRLLFRVQWDAPPGRQIAAPTFPERAPCGSGPLAETVSRASFCIYLSHLFFLDFLASRGLAAGLLPPLWAVPALALAAFAVMLFVSALGLPLSIWPAF